MAFTVVIPARYASTRLPGKPLLDIAGKPMIQHVYEQAKKSEADHIVIATDDQRIADAAIGFGADVCMTSPDHPSGTDRLQETVSQLGLGKMDIVVNVQGDEPLIPPVVINQVAENLANAPDAGIATLSEPIHDITTLKNPNVVKVVSDYQGRALYFSRAPIPWPRNAFQEDPDTFPQGITFQRHIGIYAYRVALLDSFVTWEPSPLETSESLEQLRAMENGVSIHIEEAIEQPPGGVDTEEDLQRIRAAFTQGDNG